MINFKNPLNTMKEKADAFRLAMKSGNARQLAEMKNGGTTNTYVPPKERARRKKHKQIAKLSRRQNRK